VTIHPPFVPTVELSDLCKLTAPAGSDYHWFVNGTLIPGATGQTWSAQVTGEYVVSMNNLEGCPGISGPVFAEACVSSTNNINTAVSVRVYPNPAQDRIFLDIQAARATSARIDLFAADGRYVGQLFQGDILPGGQILDLALPELAGGMYRYRLATDVGSVQGNLVVLRR